MKQHPRKLKCSGFFCHSRPGKCWSSLQRLTRINITHFRTFTTCIQCTQAFTQMISTDIWRFIHDKRIRTIHHLQMARKESKPAAEFHITCAKKNTISGYWEPYFNSKRSRLGSNVLLLNGNKSFSHKYKVSLKKDKTHASFFSTYLQLITPVKNTSCHYGWI